MRFKIILPVILLFTCCKSKDGDYTLFTPDQDVQMGAMMHEQIVADKINFNILDTVQYSQAYAGLQAIRDSILLSQKFLHREEFPWNIYILKNDDVCNAFCTPGGYIYVYTGLIKFLESEDELAGVMGHEMAHADMRHGTDQLTKTYGIKILITLITGGDYSQFADIGAGILNLSFSRSDEREADEKSVEYLSTTAYNASAFASFFKKLDEKGESPGMLQFLSTHPNPGNRVENILNKAKELQPAGHAKQNKSLDALRKALL